MKNGISNNLTFWPEEHLASLSVRYGTGGGNTPLVLKRCILANEKEKQETEDNVLGWLTAEDVFNRIKSHWDSVQRETTAK